MICTNVIALVSLWNALQPVDQLIVLVLDLSPYSGTADRVRNEEQVFTRVPMSP